MIPLEQAVGETVDAYRTCEFVTLARDGTPIAWPTATLRRDDGTFLVTTSLGFAQKALNVRRDGRVAMLFSDPTGSGLDAPQEVFMPGIAVCPEQIVTSPSGDEAYWSMLFDRQPDSRRYVDRPARWLMDWYYLRLKITISPTEVRTRAPLTAPPGDRGDAAGRTSSLPGAGILAGFPTAVLGARDAHGAPLLMRTRTVARPDGFLVEPAADCDVVPGPATLLVHRHDDRLADLYNALVRGELRQSDDGDWLLVPHRVIELSGDGSPRGQVRLLRTVRRTTKAYLRGRGLPRPRVDWQALKTLAAVPASQAAAET
ncbi:pyridoxamine 5'-phosphate oxidase family protein [Streptomyces sp. NPDC050619]|uniref:pyridoxamine 5'-phosphate oxidase family protein n=1 Tax=Streptomyces sp. NPDC050619 TaxID=3157214 RepID=UPI00343F494F